MAFSPFRVLLAVSMLVLFARGLSAAAEISGVVEDPLGRPIADAAATLLSANSHPVAHTKTDAKGKFALATAGHGAYVIVVTMSGFIEAKTTVLDFGVGAREIVVTMRPTSPLSLPVTARRIAPQNGLTGSGANKYTLTERDIDNLPMGQSSALNQVMLQMPGVALDQNQEIHIRGEHMGIQYRMNGIMLPLDINSDPTFSQLLNATFVKSASLIDGILPAQYGYRTSGIIDLESKDGCEATPAQFTAIGGQRDTAKGIFQLGGCGSKFSYYLTGMFLQSNLGFSSAVPAPDPIHDAVTQGQGFSYLTYAFDADTKLSLISGMTLAFNQFPNQPNLPPQFTLDHLNPARYPSSAINSGLNQQDYYGVMALNGVVGPAIDYQLAYSGHYNTQSFYPDAIGDLIYQGIASRVFSSDLSNSLQDDVTYRVGSAHTIRGGFYFGEYGVESDQTSQVFPIIAGVPATTPISLTANLNKINLVYGVYLQDQWRITDRLSVNFGSRWDRVTGFTTDSQFSPTINSTYKPRLDTVIHAGFARNFQVPNFQNVSSGIARLFAGTTAEVSTGGSTTPFAETDYTWDVGFTHQFTPHLAFAQDNYFRVDRHYLDEGQFGFVPIDAPFNYTRGYGGGTENSLTYNDENFAARINVTVAREEDIGVASGQYNFPADENSYIDRRYIVLDHAPLVGASGGAAYRLGPYQFTVDGLFSSGLRGGIRESDSASRGMAVQSERRARLSTAIRQSHQSHHPDEHFDRTNLIRPANGIGVFQAAYGPRITIYDAVTLTLPSERRKADRMEARG